jgi:hypothetical protein
MMLCQICKGYGWEIAGSYSFKKTCSACGGSGRAIEERKVTFPQNWATNYFDHAPSEALTADDVRSAKIDRMPWNGQVHEETKLAIALQVLRSIATEQQGASSTVRALAEATIEVIG